MGDMWDSLNKLEKHVKGRFFCLRAKGDTIDANIGELLTRHTGQQVYAVRTLDPILTQRLRTIAAQNYYGTNLSPKIDSELFGTPGGVLPPGLTPNSGFFARNIHSSNASFGSNSFSSSAHSTTLPFVLASIRNGNSNIISGNQGLQELLVPTLSVSGGVLNWTPI